MKLSNTLGGLALVASLATGCMVRAHGGLYAPAPVAVVEVDEEPPPPRVYVTETRPGFIYIQGRWIRSGGRWEWNNGYWERERSGYIYNPGRWEQRGRRHVWVDGGWRAHGEGGVQVRDHRDNRREEPRGGVDVRDHRH
jgi:hypothetical protein